MVTIPTLAFAVALWLAAPAAPPAPAPPRVPSPPAAANDAAVPEPPAVPGELPEPAITDEDVVIQTDLDEPLVVHGHAGRSRGFIGVHLLDLTPDLRQHFGVPREAGVMVAEVEPDSAAVKGGIIVGDIITSADGERIGSAGELARAVRRKRAGQTVGLDLSRDRSAKHVTVTVQERRQPEMQIGELGDFGRLRELGPEIRTRVMRELEDVRPMLELRRQRLEKRLDQMQKRLDELEKKLSRRRE